MNTPFLVLLGLLTLGPVGVFSAITAQEVSSPGVSAVVSEEGGVFIAPQGGVSDQTLTTTIRDPDHPEQPWTITTHRRPGESKSAFIKRHRDMVEAVREALVEDGE